MKIANKKRYEEFIELVGLILRMIPNGATKEELDRTDTYFSDLMYESDDVAIANSFEVHGIAELIDKYGSIDNSYLYAPTFGDLDLPMVKYKHGRYHRHGAIVIGYPGVGKSYVTQRTNNCIDLDSHYWKSDTDCERSNDSIWPDAYCTIAINFAMDGRTVFMSSHREVREFLEQHKEKTSELKVLVIFPGLEIIDAWAKRLADRFRASMLDIDYLTLSVVRERYEEHISEMMEYVKRTGFDSVMLDSVDYDLCDILEKKGIPINTHKKSAKEV